MSDKQYVITGNLTKETIFNLICNINKQGFVWRGFTSKYRQMVPSAAFYGVYDGHGKINLFEKSDTIQSFSIVGELYRIGYHINNKNKLGEYPFEIPDELTELIFPHTQAEINFLKNFDIKYYPKNNGLLQAASYVQHYHSGTSLLDFSVNPLKALYFAVGKKNEDFENDSYLFGLPVNWFQTHKTNFTNGFWSKEKYRFDLYFPSYYKNTRLRNQEGLFIYQLFDIEPFHKGEWADYKYMNILDLFESWFNTDIHKGSHVVFDEMDLKDIEEKSKNSAFNGFDETIGIFYVSLKIPKEEKPYLKHYLNSIGIDDNFMMGETQAVRNLNTKETP